MPFGDKLREKRKEMGMTQEDLAEKINMELTRQSISKWEKGPASYPEVGTLLALAVVLDVSLDELFADELRYLRKGCQDDDDFFKKYPGAVAGLEALAEAMKNM